VNALFCGCMCRALECSYFLCTQFLKESTRVYRDDLGVCLIPVFDVEEAMNSCRR